MKWNLSFADHPDEKHLKDLFGGDRIPVLTPRPEYSKDFGQYYVLDFDRLGSEAQSKLIEEIQESFDPDVDEAIIRQMVNDIGWPIAAQNMTVVQ